MNSRDFYYIMFGSVNYDEEPYFLTCEYKISRTPDRLKVFTKLEDAVNYKHKLLSDDAYRSSYMFGHYEINIERF